MDFASWLAGTGRQSCTDCRAQYAKQARRGAWSRFERNEPAAGSPNPPPRPPCASCRPKLLRVNVPVIEVWQQVGGQWIYTPAGYLSGLDMGAVNIGVRLLADQHPGLDRRRLIADVLLVANIVAEARNREITDARNRN